MASNEGSSTKSTIKYSTLGEALYSLVSFIEGYDQQVLSMCMRAFELTLGFSQSQLSTLATVSTMSRMGCCIIWGLLVDKYDSNYVLGAGLLLMGMASIFLSSAWHYRVIVFLRFLHGFGFACVYPVQQKIVSDSTGSEELNKPGESGSSAGKQAVQTETDAKKSKAKNMFTIFQSLNCIGRLLCAVITTLIARKVLLGYYGWRTSYVVLGYVWIMFGIAIVFGMYGKKCSPSNDAPSGTQAGGDAGNTPFYTLLANAAKAIFSRATTWILIFTLFIAEAPMSAFNYMTIYLQYLGVSDTMAGVAIAVTLIGGAAGSGAGGVIIKEIAKKEDKYGELISGSVVMLVRLLVCLIFFLGKPPCGKLLWYHYIELATLGGTLVSMGGVDRELMKKSIEKEHQGTAAAMVRTISGITSSVILFQVCAYLTEKVFGYVPSRESFETMAAEVKERNAEALRKSMMYIILAGTIVNVLCYAALFATYPGDKKIANPDEGQESSSSPSPQ